MFDFQNCLMKKLYFNTFEWDKKCAEFINQNIIFFLQRDGYCSVILTGGRSAEKVYNRLAIYLPTYIEKIDFFIGDERCVSEMDAESNYGMILNSLFKNHTSKINVVHKFYDSGLSIQDNLIRYENQLPKCPNLLLLGLGDDGHIASLFPGSDYSPIKTRVISVISPTGQERVTITPSYITSAERILILAQGTVKKEIISSMTLKTKAVDVPAALVKNGTWLTVK